ncbi:hypothetical protein G7Y89_g5904 [Cudoniella acicularis]|uniref:Uncharacterized protein n=1 Tax=Cudoniella acicularis TaxID=354080 RepID=A0A8H4W2Z1_9HELO|nr:hypothetical protein G7Y89_g5904 [Cudoniella acicularis]
MPLPQPLPIDWYVPKNEPPQARLTFGIEFEFALATSLSASIPDLNPDDPHPAPYFPTTHNLNTSFANQHIAQTLTDAGIPTEVYDSQNPQKGSRCWIVKSDITVKGPSNLVCSDKYKWEAIEINSPHYYSRNALGVVKRVLRKFIALCVMTEPQLNTIHPEHRLRNHNCVSLRENSILMLKKAKNDIKSAINWLLSPDFEQNSWAKAESEALKEALSVIQTEYGWIPL